MYIGGVCTLCTRSHFALKAFLSLHPAQVACLVSPSNVGKPLIVGRERLDVSDDDQTAARPRDHHIEAAPIRQKADVTPAIAADCAEENELLLTACKMTPNEMKWNDME